MEKSLFLGMNSVVINADLGRIGGTLQSFPSPAVTNVLACETDVEIETLLTFASTATEYQLLVSNSQMVGHDYSYWVSRCSGKLYIA